MKKIILILLSSIIVVILLLILCKPKPPIQPTDKIDSLKHVITNINDSISILDSQYEKTCSIINVQSFHDDSLFFTNYLERFRLRNDSGRVKAH
jgi:hypothetical protein